MNDTMEEWKWKAKYEILQRAYDALRAQDKGIRPLGIRGFTVEGPATGGNLLGRILDILLMDSVADRYVRVLVIPKTDSSEALIP